MREVLLVAGPAMFEIGAMFFLSKLFFISEDDEKTIARLQIGEKEINRSFVRMP